MAAVLINIIKYLIAFFLSFLIVKLSMKWFLKWSFKANLLGVDVHKESLPKIPKSGGILWIFSYLVGIFFLYPFVSYSTQIAFIASGYAVTLAALIGLIHDMADLPWRVKALTPLLASIPLISMRLGLTTVKIPFIGPIDFGIFYYLIIIPMLVTGCANTVNMLGGLNGVESGGSLIVAAALTIGSVMAGPSYEMGYALMVPLLGASLALFIYNKYPSKVFVGDVGTLSFGVAFACYGILANLERSVLICLLPYIINSILILLGKTMGVTPSTTLESGYFKANSPFSLRCLIAKAIKADEPKTVQLIWLIIALASIASIILIGK